MSALLVTDRTTLSHLEQALDGYITRLRRNGIAPPPDLLALLRSLTASRGQARPNVAPGEAAAHDHDMSLAVTYADAGRMLGISERTVRREVAAGRIPTVDLGIGRAARRIRVQDIRNRLAEGSGSRSSVASAGHRGGGIEECTPQTPETGRPQDSRVGRRPVSGSNSQHQHEETPR